MPTPPNSLNKRVNEDNKAKSFKCSKCQNTWFEQVMLNRLMAGLVVANQRLVPSSKQYPFLKCIQCNHLEQLITSFEANDVEFNDLLDVLEEKDAGRPNTIKADEV